MRSFVNKENICVINSVSSDSFTSKLYFFGQKCQNLVENNKAKGLYLRNPKGP